MKIIFFLVIACVLAYEFMWVNFLNRELNFYGAPSKGDLSIIVEIDKLSNNREQILSLVKRLESLPGKAKGQSIYTKRLGGVFDKAQIRVNRDYQFRPGSSDRELEDTVLDLLSEIPESRGLEIRIYKIYHFGDE